jgi:hypothetical protein
VETEHGVGQALGSVDSIDPKRMTVKELLPQLMGRSEDDLRAVLRREVSGRNRVSVVRHINDLLAECDQFARHVDFRDAPTVAAAAPRLTSNSAADDEMAFSADWFGVGNVDPAAGPAVDDTGGTAAQPEGTTQFCTSCGTPTSGLKYCGNCGTAVGGVARRAGDIDVGGVDPGGRLTISRKGVITVTIIALLVVGVAAAAWAVLGRATEKHHTVKGEMTLNDYGSFRYDKIGDSCSGDGGYSDIDEGATVSVKNQSGTLIGSGRLGPGTVQGGSTLKWCVFPFEVGGVKDAEFFQVEVSHRGGLSYSKAEMQANDWTVHASLGS